MFFPSTRTSPLVGRSMPAIRFNNVDLPEPDGPIRHRNPPDSRCRFVLFKATTSVASRLKTFLTFRISTAAMSGPLRDENIHSAAEPQKNLSRGLRG